MTITRRAALALALVVTLAAALGLQQPQPASTAPLTVRLVIDFGDGLQKHFTALPWSKGMTALDAMNAAKAHPRGITFSHKGDGDTAFLTDIDGLKNDGAAGPARNWHYWINTTLGDRSFGVAPLNPGDTLTWHHTPRQLTR